MSLAAEHRAELETAVEAKLRESLEANLPQIRERLEAAAQGKNHRRAAEARRMLERLHDEYGAPQSS